MYQGNKNWSFRYSSVYELIYGELDLSDEASEELEEWLAKRRRR